MKRWIMILGVMFGFSGCMGMMYQQPETKEPHAVLKIHFEYKGRDVIGKNMQSILEISEDGKNFHYGHFDTGFKGVSVTSKRVKPFEDAQILIYPGKNVNLRADIMEYYGNTKYTCPVQIQFSPENKKTYLITYAYIYDRSKVDSCSAHLYEVAKNGERKEIGEHIEQY